ncbi:SGNH/GDSL hydrolase family protein [Nonomuraea africana]|uniref:SGNH/GDSL hydrolase family protein n=1 Tax=Nonomuraea africana TaxID=46171 RepID=UPI003402D6D8
MLQEIPACHRRGSPPTWPNGPGTGRWRVMTPCITFTHGDFMFRYARLRPVQRATVVATAVLGTCATLVTAGGGTAAAAGTSASSSIAARYVALGDSYASGYGIDGVENAACDRSTSSYPSILRSTYKSQSFTSVACSGATTRSIWNTQGSQAPQIKALKPDTSLVTLTLGGNDIGFTQLVITCASLMQSQPTGDPCRQNFRKGGKDQILARIDDLKPRIASVLTDIKRKSPQATIALVGYPSLLPDSGESCRSTQVPFADGDFGYLRNITKRLNSALREQAAKAGAVYVDTYTPTIGYDMCRAQGRMIEPLFTADGRVAPAAAHPNLGGTLSMAAIIKKKLDALGR